MSLEVEAAWPHHHAVQFYEDKQFLVERVAEFLAEGSRRGEPCIVIATADHTAAFSERLRTLGCNPDGVTFLDARATVDQFLDGRVPDEARFRHVIGSAMDRLGGSKRHLRAYGEMVDLLWRDGEPDAAIRLEELWNGLANDYSFALLCSYPMGNFDKAADGKRFDAMCAAHSIVRPTERSSFDGVEERERRVAMLEQRAAALEAEIERRKELETRLKDALEARLRSEGLLRDFVDNATIGLHWVQADGKIEWANDAELNLLGYTREEYVGHNIKEFHADAQRIDDILCRLTNNEEIHDYEAPIRAKDGSVKWVAISSNVLIENGTFIHTRCFSRDITGKKRFQQQNEFLLRATDVMGRSFDYGTRLNDLAHVVVPELADWCVIDMATEDGYERLAIAHADPEVERRSREIYEAWQIPAERDPVVRVMQRGEPVILPHITEAYLEDLAVGKEALARLRNLTLRSVMMVPMFVQGRVAGVITFIGPRAGRSYNSDDLPLALDLAARAASMMEIARLYQVAESNNRAKDEFLATLSHELRTPLTAILGWARMLSVGGLDEDTTRTAIATITRSARTQAALIDDLLDVSRVVGGKLLLVDEPVDLSDVVGNVWQAMRVAADARAIRINVKGLEERSVVQGDPTRLQQIIWNLLSNAIKFSDEGGRVDVTLEQGEGAQARLTVSDEGRGIPRSFLPYVFDPFRQADSTAARVHGGLGLGLAIVKYLVELHGGTVRAESAGAGKGATFTVSLPLARHKVSAASEPELLADLRGVRVLIVDDDDGSLQMLHAAFTRCGAGVETANSVVAARTMLRQTTPHAVITDFAMPDEDGVALLREVRQYEALKHVPVFALTGFSQTEEQAAEFAGFFRKPMDPMEVARRVHEVMNGARPE
jgi:PAS domain S-box-containing protein